MKDSDQRALSSAIDGELDAAQAHRMIEAMRTQHELRAAWLMHHIAADVLRQGPSTLDDARFLRRFSQQLASEPIHLPSPAQRERAYASQPARTLTRTLGRVAAVAAAVGALAWGLSAQVAGLRGVHDDADQARGASPVFEAYVLAHQQYAPSVRMQGGALYLHTVSLDSGGPSETGRASAR